MKSNYAKKKVKTSDSELDKIQIDHMAAKGSFVFIEGAGLLRST